MVPALVVNVARQDDPIVRDANGLLDAIKARVPGLSTGVLPRRNLWGGEIEQRGMIGPDFVSPITESALRSDPIASELIALKAWPAPVEKKIRDVTLTPEQYDRYQTIAGRVTHYALRELLRAPRLVDAS